MYCKYDLEKSVPTKTMSLDMITWHNGVQKEGTLHMRVERKQVAATNQLRPGSPRSAPRTCLHTLEVPTASREIKGVACIIVILYYVVMC